MWARPIIYPLQCRKGLSNIVRDRKKLQRRPKHGPSPARHRPKQHHRIVQHTQHSATASHNTKTIITWASPNTRTPIHGRIIAPTHTRPPHHVRITHKAPPWHITSKLPHTSPESLYDRPTANHTRPCPITSKSLCDRRIANHTTHPRANHTTHFESLCDRPTANHTTHPDPAPPKSHFSVCQRSTPQMFHVSVRPIPHHTKHVTPAPPISHTPVLARAST